MRVVTLLRVRRLGRVVLPWASLGTGVTGALLMDRGPKQGLAIALAAVALWILLPVLLIVHRVQQRTPLKERSTLLKGLQLSSLFAIQSTLQLALFFALPFFWRAWAGTMEQLVFLLVLSLAAAMSLWDPFTERCLTRPLLAPLLPALASFAGLVAVLPGFGISNTSSLWIAAGATSLALPIGFLCSPSEQEHRWRRVLVYMVVGLSLPLSLLVGAARMIPAAPLSLVKAEIGTRLEGREIADPVDHLERRPAELICATAIRAPLGVRERLFHVWRHDDAPSDRIELGIKGGREQGFRTWSRKRHWGKHPQGRWTCTVETALGQQLGGDSITIGE